MTAPRHRICALRRGWCELAPCVFLGRPPSRTFAPSSCHECARFGRCRPGRLVLMEALGARHFFDPMQAPCSHELTYSLAPQSSTVPWRLAWRLEVFLGRAHSDACPDFLGRPLSSLLLRLSSTDVPALVLSGHLKLLGRPIPSLALSRCARRRRQQELNPRSRTPRAGGGNHRTTGASARKGTFESSASRHAAPTA